MNPRLDNLAPAVFLLFWLALSVLFGLSAFIVFSSNLFAATMLVALSLYCALPFLKHLAQITGIQKIWEATKTFSNKENPLIQAVCNGELGKVERLLQSSTIEETAHSNNNAALRLASLKGETAIVNRLLKILKVRAAAHALENEALWNAVLRGHADIALHLLDIPAVYNNAHANENETLRLAVRKGNTALVRRLLTAPEVVKNAHACNNIALRVAAAYGNLDIVEQLLAIDAVANTAHCALWGAAFYGHALIVQRLLAIPEVLNHADDNSNEVLRVAVRKNNEETVALLLRVQKIRNSVPPPLRTCPVIKKFLQAEENAGALPGYQPMRKTIDQFPQGTVLLANSFAVTSTQEWNPSSPNNAI